VSEAVVILGLDPGASTGFAKCAFYGEKITVLDYGIVPILGNQVEELVCGILVWLRNNHPAEVLQHLVFSEIPYLPKRRTHFPSIEVQGVIRAARGVGYNPMTIHSQLSTRKKADTKAFVKRVLGFTPTSIDHVVDAFAVCFCHALKIGVWQPHLEALPARTPISRQKRVVRCSGGKDGHLMDLPENPTQDEIRAAFDSGKARVGR